MEQVEPRAGESTLPTDDLATTTLLYYYILLHVKNKTLFISFFIKICLYFYDLRMYLQL